MEQVFSYVNQMGASVMMPILFTIIGLCIGLKFGKSMKSGLYVGIGFVGLGIVTGLLTANFPEPINKFSKVFGLTLDVFDMGWPAAASVAYNTLVGALIIPVCLGVNFLMLVTKTTRTVNIDLWNYWHFAFIGAVAYFVMDHSLAWGYFAAIVCYINTLVMADITADKFQGYYSDLKGISIPHPFCQSFTPFAVGINWLLDKIPGFSKLNIDAEGMKKKFGVLGEPLVLGIIVGALIAALSHINDFADMETYRQALEAKQQGKGILTAVTMTDAWVSIVKDILFLGVTMGAVMELIPRITKLFIDGLMPISDKTREVVKNSKFINSKFKISKVYIGMSPALVIGHPTTLAVSVLLIPVILVIAVLAPGNQFLPVASLAGIFYLFPMILPYTKGNVIKTFIIGLVAMTIGLFFVTDMAPAFTSAANDVFKTTGDPSSKIPFKDGGNQYFAGALDFASSLIGWVIYKCVNNLKWIGMGVLTLITIAMVFWNRQRIVADEMNAQE